MTAETWWIATGIFIVGYALVCAGIWLKSGPELAMIVGGVLLVWFASIGLKTDNAND